MTRGDIARANRRQARRAAFRGEIASRRFDAACAEAARQCGVGYAALTPGAGPWHPDADFTYVVPTKFSDRTCRTACAA